MSIWYCESCQSYFDPSTQDHADYERNMCEDCVDREEERKDEERAMRQAHLRSVFNVLDIIKSQAKDEDTQPKDDCTDPGQVVAVLRPREFISPHSRSTGGKV